MKMGMSLAAMMGLEQAMVPDIVNALEKIAGGNVPVLWLQGQSCSGCSVSLLNAEAPGPAQILTHYISLKFHPTLSATTGEACMKVINDTIKRGGHILVVEGSIPIKMEKACLVGGETFAKLVTRAGRTAKAAVAVGTCAAFGGIPAAEGNPTGAVGLSQCFKWAKIPTPVISLPGCPMHPEWFIGTLVHVLKFGLPALDDLGRPKMFFGKLVHDQCPRFAEYERKHFAKYFSDDGCLFELGCMGPITHADCPKRKWNSGTNWCVDAGAPCIGCAMPQFAFKKSFPFYRKNEFALKARK